MSRLPAAPNRDLTHEVLSHEYFLFLGPPTTKTHLCHRALSNPAEVNGRFPSHPHLRYRWGKNSVFLQNPRGGR